MTLLKECIEALGNKCEIKASSETVSIFNEFKKRFPLTAWGRIDWSQTKVIKKGVYSYEFIPKILEVFTNQQTDVLILWDEATLPVIKSKLDLVISVIDDVTAVSSNTWIYALSENKVVEFFHDGNITVGVTVT